MREYVSEKPFTRGIYQHGPSRREVTLTGDRKDDLVECRFKDGMTVWLPEADLDYVSYSVVYEDTEQDSGSPEEAVLRVLSWLQSDDAVEVPFTVVGSDTVTYRVRAFVNGDGLWDAKVTDAFHAVRGHKNQPRPDLVTSEPEPEPDEEA